MKHDVVLIEDEESFLRILTKSLEAAHYRVIPFSNPRQALKFIHAEAPGIIISDIRLSGATGFDILLESLKVRKDAKVILITGFDMVDNAVQAVRQGAYEFLTKPFPMENLLAVLNSLNLDSSVSSVAPGPGGIFSEPGNRLVVHSPGIKKVLAQVEKIAMTDSSILILGESGVGKELIANYIHQKSLRANNSFVAINCSNLSPELFESEVFGHVKGSFTGALGDKKGLIQMAEGGTFFLDEIGDLSSEGQAKILRLLQEKEYKRVGENFSRKSNVRILAATNKNLEGETVTGRFRLDLFYRLSTFCIEVPPLRNRSEDIPDLAVYFIEKYGKDQDKKVEPPSEVILQLLSRYPWPGNIRELQNACKRAVTLANSPFLKLNDFPSSLFSENPPQENLKPEGSPMGSKGKHPYEPMLKTLENQDIPLGDKLDFVEKILVEEALERTGWNFSQSAQILGLSRQSFQYKIKKYGFSKN